MLDYKRKWWWKTGIWSHWGGAESKYLWL